MTPLDDELRRTLSARAGTVARAPAPRAGIESRARGIRRRRTAFSVLGVAAAAAAVALAVPALLPSDTARLEPAAPTPTPTVTVTPTPAAPQLRPANVLAWPLRGKDAYSPDTLDLRRRFVQAFGRTDPDDAEYEPLFVYRVDGVSFTMGQAWLKDSSKAYAVSYAVASDNVPQFFVGPATPANPWGLAFLVSGMPDHDLLVVVPRPGTGQVMYDDNASGAFRPADMPTGLDGVALVERDLQASDDRLQTLDGNGDLDHPLFESAVTPLLCGLKECG
jgi:hypothetical protein